MLSVAGSPDARRGGASLELSDPENCRRTAYGTVKRRELSDLHDSRATVPHLLGLDHERLTYRYAGRDFRLTDVYGRVVKEIMI